MEDEMKKITAVLLMVLMFTGCALIDRINRDDTSTQLVVQYATIKLIDQSSAVSSSDVLEHVGRVKAVIDRESATTVAALIQEAESHIPWNKIDRADQLLVRALIVAVSDELEDRVGDGTLDPEHQLTVLAMLNWIEQAARM